MKCEMWDVRRKMGLSLLVDPAVLATKEVGYE